MEVKIIAILPRKSAKNGFQCPAVSRCHRGYEDTIARIIRKQLEILFLRMLAKQHTQEEEEGIKITAVMLSWGIYGASEEWRKSDRNTSPEEFIKSAIPYVLSGIGFQSDK